MCFCLYLWYWYHLEGTFRWNHGLSGLRTGQIWGLGSPLLTQKKRQVLTWPFLDGDLGLSVCIQCGWESFPPFQQAQQALNPAYRQNNWVKAMVLNWGWLLFPRRHLATCGDFFLAITTEKEVCYWHPVAEVKDTVKYLLILATVLHNKKVSSLKCHG